MSYPGHVPPKRAAERWAALGNLALAAAIFLIGFVVGQIMVPTSTTVTHIDQMASACEELQ